MTDHPDQNSDENVGRLVSRAGPRTPMPDEMKARLANGFRSELEVARVVRTRRRFAFASMAACLLLAVLAFPLLDAPPQKVVVAAHVERTVGQPRWHTGEDEGPLRAGNRLNVGDVLETDSNGRVLMHLPGPGLDVRVDSGSAVRIGEAGLLQLDRGRIYVDAGPGAGPLVVLAGGLEVRHTGTQYSVVTNGAVTVSVREGEIQVLDAEGAETRARATTREATRLTFGADGRVSREAVPTFGEQWAWVNDVSPAFDTRGRTAAEIVSWVARETGRHVSYADAATESFAQSPATRLMGTLPAGAMLEGLAASGLGTEISGSEILVYRL